MQELFTAPRGPIMAAVMFFCERRSQTALSQSLLQDLRVDPVGEEHTDVRMSGKNKKLQNSRTIWYEGGI